jgi:hypothetical protein
MTRRTSARLRLALGVLVLAALLAGTAGASSASASGGWWLINQSFAPNNLVSGEEAAIVVTAVDGGYQPIEAVKTKKTTSNIVLSDTLPANTEIIEGSEAIEGQAGPQEPKPPAHPLIKLPCTTTGTPATGQTVSCTIEGLKLLPFEEIRLKVLVKVLASNGTNLTNRVNVSGGAIPGEGAAPSGSSEKTANVTGEAPAFGLEREGYKLRPENQDGSLDTQAGSHPFQLSTTFNLAKNLFSAIPAGNKTPRKFFGSPALTKNLHFVLPPGLLGRVAGFPKCPSQDFNEVVPGPGGLNACPTNTAIGVASASIYTPVVLGDYTASVPIFNLQPNVGEPARFGFTIDEVPVVLTTAVRTGSDYGVEVSVHYAPQTADVLSSQVVFWGVPGDPRHDSQRGWACLDGKYWVEGAGVEEQCENEDAPNPQALLTMPAVCGANPVSTVSGESWPKTEGEASETSTFSGGYTFESPFSGCDKLPFTPSISVTPDQSSTSTPTGLNVHIKVPQATTLSAEGLAEADIRDTALKLPAGMVTSGGAAEKLMACTANQIGLSIPGIEEFTPQLESQELSTLLANNSFTPSADTCPQQAKVGTVVIKTPLVEEPLYGSVYLARVHAAPFESPLVLYITAEEKTSKVKVKLAGEVTIDEATGQLTSTFKGAPPLPFEDLELHLFNDRATQSTPERCGVYKSAASFFASSSTPGHPVEVGQEPSFAITSGPGGGACPTAPTLPFGTPVKAGPQNTKGGAFSPFVVVLERPDGDQALKSITVHEPPGAAAMLASVTPCPTAVAEQPEPNCPASSQIGESTAFAGLGSEPTQIPGQVYLTGPYHGAPFGLLAVTDATHVGPFDLGKIPVLSTITVDQTTAAATITSNPLPQWAPRPGGATPEHPLGSTGIPSQIKKLVIDVNRPGFTFNPTNCEAKSTTVETSGYEGGTSSTAAPYPLSGCGTLPFKPTISVNVESNYSRTEGTGMKIKLVSGKGQANIKLTKLVFPESVPSRLTTIQKACPSQVFNANPASCPEGSVIGSAVAHTPVLKSPLTGPAYLVSHANESFPDAVFVLQGEGIKLILDGKTNIKGGVTSSTFATVPDAPVETFEVTLPRGPHSAFSGFGNLCEKPIEVPTTFGGQNGALIEGKTHVTVEKCGKGGALPIKKESELAKLLKKCKKLKNHKKRVKCEATARKQVKAVASCKKKNKGHTKKINSCVTKARKKYALKLK